MGIHTFGFFENQDGGAAQQKLAALVDALSPLYKVGSTADHLVVPATHRFLVGAHAHVDATVQPRAVLVAGSMKTRYRGRTSLEIPRLSASAEPASPPVINDWRANPIELDSGEELTLETINDPVAATDQFTVLYASDGPVQAIQNPRGFWARFTTAASACTANTWNSRALVASEALLKGRYQVLGGVAISTSLIQARLNFPLGGHARPPIASCDARADLIAPMFQPGQLGVLGEFDHDSLPFVELLTDTTDNEVQVIDLFLTPVGGA